MINWALMFFVMCILCMYSYCVEIGLIWGRENDTDVRRIRIRKLPVRSPRRGNDRRTQEMVTLVRTNKKLLWFPAPVSIITKYLLCM